MREDHVTSSLPEEVSNSPKGGAFFSIQGRLIILVLLVFIPILLSNIYFFYDRYQYRKGIEIQANLEVARAVGTAFDSFVQDVLHQELAIGIAATASPPLSPPDFTKLLDASAKDAAAVRAFSWLNPQGRVLASSNPDVIGMDLSDRPYFKEFLSGKGWVITDLLPSKLKREQGEPLFGIIRSIRDDKGNLLGLVVASIVPNSLGKILDIERTKDAGVSLIDSSGMHVYRYPAVEYTWEQRDWLRMYPVIEGALKGEEIATTVTSWVSGKKRLVGFAPVSSIGWVAAASREEDAALGPIISALFKETGVILLISLMSLLAAFGLSKIISISVTGLRNHALLVSLGETESPLVASGPTELQDLAGTFNMMAAKVRSREMALRDSEERFRTLYEEAPIPYQSLDEDGRILMVNRAWLDTLGYSGEEVIGKWFGEFLVSNCQGSFQERFPCFKGEGEVRGAEFEMIRKDGRTILTSFNGRIGKDSDGRFKQTHCIFLDITERKRMEEELRGSRDELELRVRERTAELTTANQVLESQGEVLQAIVDHIPVMLCFYDSAGQVLLASREMEKLLGWSLEELKTTAIMSEVYPDPEYRRMVWSYMIEAVPGWRDFVMTTRGGRTLEASWANVLMSDGSRIGIGIDVTERKRAEQALRESEERYRGIFENAPFGIFQTTTRGEYLSANPAVAGMLGYESPAELISVIKDIGSQLYVNPSLRKEIVRQVLEQSRQLTFENRYYRSDGSILTVNLTVWGARDADGSIRYLEGFVEDITDRKRAEEELKSYMTRLEESNQALQDFASIASHDMQEPLRKIISFGNILKHKHGAAIGEGKNYLDRILSATDRMQNLLKSLLDYSRIATQAEPFREVDLNAIIREVLSDLEVRIERTGGQVDVGELPVLSAEPTQMRQLFQNLVGNGLKFHRQGQSPVVKVRGGVDGDGQWIVVEDNGIGFEEEHLERIFAPFQRLHGRSSQYEGTGMGLAICRKIVERHGGTITARSTPGLGSTFVITLPEKQSAKD